MVSLVNVLNESIQRIIASNFSIHKECSVFRKAIDINSIFSNDDIDTHLMSIYLGHHNNDVSDYYLSETNLYYPPNKDSKYHFTSRFK